MMNELAPEWFSPLVHALGLGLLHSLWQCALIAAIAAVALRALRHASPQARYAVSCWALALCVLWPAATVVEALLGATSATMPEASARSDAGTAIVARFAASDGGDEFAAWLPWLVALWAAGVAAMLLRLGGGLRWVAHLRRSARTVADPVLQSRLDRLAAHFGLNGMRFAIFDGEGGPLSIGLWRPMVLMPAALLARMPVGMLEALLAHELAHIRRHDYLVNLLQRFAEALLFHHPAAWWLSHRIRIEREQVADDLAAAALGEPRRLAEALHALDRCLAPPPTLAQAAHGGHLMSRIQSLLRPQRRVPSGTALLPIAALALASIAFIAYAQSTRPGAAVAAASATAAVPANANITTSIGGLAVAGTGATERNGYDGYAIVETGPDGLSISGDVDDISAIRAAQAEIGGAFLWFRRHGVAYAVRDPATLERVRAAWAPHAATELEMSKLQARMAEEERKLEAIGREIETSAASMQEESPRVAEAIREIEALAGQQAAEAEKQAAQAERIAAQASSGSGNEAEMARLEREMQAFDARMRSYDEKMRALEAVIEAESARMARDTGPLADVEAKMEAATLPLKSLETQMETLGARQDRIMAEVDRKIEAEIRRAVAEGLARPIQRNTAN